MSSCPICFESLLDKSTASPDVCEHVFCLTCLTKWSKCASYCPIDRKRYKKIVKLDSEETIQIKPKRQKKSRHLYDITSFCEICTLSNNGNTLLLCDCCDLGYHTQCLKPPLKSVPSGRWFCPTCRAVERKLRAKKGVKKEARRIKKAIKSNRASTSKISENPGPSNASLRLRRNYEQASTSSSSTYPIYNDSSNSSYDTILHEQFQNGQQARIQKEKGPYYMRSRSNGSRSSCSDIEEAFCQESRSLSFDKNSKSSYSMPGVSIINPSKQRIYTDSEASTITLEDSEESVPFTMSESLDNDQSTSDICNLKHTNLNYTANEPSLKYQSKDSQAFPTCNTYNFPGTKSHHKERNSQYIYEKESDDNSNWQANNSKLNNDYFNLRTQPAYEVNAPNPQSDSSKCVSVFQKQTMDLNHSDLRPNPLHNFEARNTQYAMNAKMNLQTELKKIEQEKWKSWRSHSLKKSRRSTSSQNLLDLPKKYVKNANSSSSSNPSHEILNIDEYRERIKKGKWLPECTVVLERISDNSQRTESRSQVNPKISLNVFQTPEAKKDSPVIKKQQVIMTSFNPYKSEVDTKNSNYSIQKNVLEAALRMDLKKIGMRKDGSLYVNWAKPKRNFI